MKSIIGAALLCALFSSPTIAAVVVVVHPENTATLSKKAVQRLFLGKLTEFSTGQIPTVINQSPGEDIRGEFDQNILNSSTAQVNAKWAKLVFTGRGFMPAVVDSDAEVIELIKQNKNAIGYIDSSSVSEDVKVVNLD